MLHNGPSSGNPLANTPSPAQTALPYDVLTRIFEQSARAPTQQDWGGALFGWQSNEDIARLALVCKSWREPAEHVLYRSCSLLSAKDAESFLSTLESRSDLAGKVQFLVVGLNEEETWPSSEEDDMVALRPLVAVEGGKTQMESSASMVRVLAACPNVRHFQVRPLHDSARLPLLAALRNTSLETLVCAPRLRKPTVEWTGSLFHQSDITILNLPTLRNLELDAWTVSTSHLVPTSFQNGNATLSLLSLPFTSPPTSPPVATSRLITLRLRFDMSDGDLFDLLANAGKHLQIADVYVERVVPPEAAAVALSHSISSLRELRWITNPPIEGFGDVNLAQTPLFDRILPDFQVLDRLSISATDVSHSVLSLLPPSLLELEVQAYTYRGPFKFSESMIKTLSTRSIQFKLQRFTVCDSEELWKDEDVLAMTTACDARGITFNFVADEDGDTDSR